VAAISLSFPRAVISDISRTGSELLVLGEREQAGTVMTDADVWVVPVVGGTPRRLGLRATGAAWSPDGGKIAYTNGADVGLANADGSGARTLWTAQGPVFTPAWSPDGRRLRVTVVEGTRASVKHLRLTRWSLWELEADGSRPRPVLPGSDLAACCGRWTPDGRYFVFETEGDGKRDIWALREATGFLSRSPRKPVRLTQGLLDFYNPAPSRDGRRVFAVGQRLRGELVRYDARSGQFVPYLSGISAEGLDFSRDGQWVAYVAFPEGTLWRSRVDGSDRLQLTLPQLSAALPRWSPDGQRIAFMGAAPDEPWKLRLVAADGGPSPPLLPGDRSEVDPSWSPDGRALAFGSAIGEQAPDRPVTIHLLDLDTRRVSLVEGSEGLFSPRWSPDGRYLAAVSGDSLRLMLFEFASGQWRELLAEKLLVAYPSWSRDSKSLFVSSGSVGLRLGITDGRREEVASFEVLRRAPGPFSEWVGQAPDGSVLTLRDVSVQEIYALELEGP
jgi:Tol biopolymer transport system component